MKPILDRLDEIQKVINAATPESHWPTYFHEYDIDDSPTLRGPYCYWLKFMDKVQAENQPFAPIKADAQFTAQSRTFSPQLVEALRVAVEALDVLRDNRPKEQVWLLAEDGLARIAKILCPAPEGEGK